MGNLKVLMNRKTMSEIVITTPQRSAAGGLCRIIFIPVRLACLAGGRAENENEQENYPENPVN